MTPHELLVKELKTLVKVLESNEKGVLPDSIRFSIDIEDGVIFTYNLSWKDDVIAN